MHSGGTLSVVELQIWLTINLEREETDGGGVRRLGGCILDAALAASIFMLFYSRTFRSVDHGPLWSYQWDDVVSTAGLVRLPGATMVSDELFAT